MQTIHKFKKTSFGMLSKNRIIHIGALLSIGACITATYMLPASVLPVLYGRISDVLIYLLYVLYFTFSFLISVPFVYGLCVFEYNTVNGEKQNITDLFYAFSSMQLYNRSLLLAYSLFWRFLLVFAPALFTFYHLTIYNSGIYLYFKPISLFGLDFTYTFLCCVFVFFATIGFAIYSRFFTATYLVVEDEDMAVSKCFLFASVYNHGFKKKMFLTALSFIPLIIVSVITFGILFLLHTIPFILITFFNLAKYRCDTSEKPDYLPKNN